MEGLSGSSEGGIKVHYIITRLISNALTSLFALVGAIMGAITGALASKASDCGALRGAGLGALAGAVLSVQVLEASRAYCRQELSGTRNSLADFMEELLRERLSELDFLPELLIANHLTNDYNMDDEVSYKGLSEDSSRRLSWLEISDESKPTQSICCVICLQDIEVGEIARSLPLCQHMFHRTCVDKWLTRHVSCPICRQRV